MAVANVSEMKDWAQIEKELELKEREMLEKEGVMLPTGHMDGYKYRPKPKVVEKQPWDVVPTPNCMPKCYSANWSHQDVVFEIGEGIAYVTLNRPTANNALNDSISQGLHDAAFELSKRNDIRIVILRAEGKMFCAGGDPKSFADAGAMSDADNRKAAVSFMKFLYFFQSLPQFTMALAQGSAMGSGIGLLAVCDMVVAASNARFTCSEVKLGHTPIAIAPYLVQKLGPANTKRMLCTAENCTAEAAKHMGLVQEIVEDEAEFSNVVSEICEKLTLCAPIATAASKRLVQNVNMRPITEDILTYTGAELAFIRIQDEAVKGMVAVQARTKPFWAEAPIKPMY